ncbi:MAG: glycosyltransferase family 39 protein [Chloroflexota bacterium]
MTESPPSLFGRYHTLVLVILFLAAAAIRLYDLTDLPLDFHPTRQLFSAIKARGMYYETLTSAPADQRQFAIQQGKLKVTVEPEALERLVAFTWRFTGEQLWVARVYSILFWLIGGIFLYLLARDLFTSDGSLFTLAFYLLLPYAVLASRSFQPDPLMLALLLGFWWSVYRWSQTLPPNPALSEVEESYPLPPNSHPASPTTQHATRNTQHPSWPYVLLASLLGGLAIFIKLNAAFFVIGGALGASFGRASLRDLLRNRQVWAMAVLGILPGSAYVAYGLSRGFLGQQFGGRFLPSLLLSPAYPLGWANMIANVTGLFPFALALLGLTLVTDKPARVFLLGLWGAYLAFGIFFDYHISTHDYYSLPLIPIAALTLTPLWEAVSARLDAATEGSRVNRAAVASFLTLGLLAVLWTSRVALKSVDYRPEAAFWNQISETVRGHRVVALTQDYGSRLVYWGWTNAAIWPDSSDIEYHSDLRGGDQTFDKRFAKLTEGRDLFLVTDLADLANQPDLQARLSHFAIFAQGEGYIIYDLTTPLP